MIEAQLRDVDFVLVLQTQALAQKRVGYVNKEIALARERAQHYRGSFLVPLMVEGLLPEERIEELSTYQGMFLRDQFFGDDLAAVISTLRRDYQRRQKG
jgi:hypothetical protein